MKALKESKATIPEDLLTMAKEHAEKVKRGEARAHGSGYGGSGFKFDSAEEDKEKDRRKVSSCALDIMKLLENGLLLRKDYAAVWVLNCKRDAESAYMRLVC